MEKNVGKKDAYFRYAMAVVFLVLAYFYSWWLLIPAVFMAITAYMGMCGIYKVFGCNTCKIKTK